MVVCVVLCTVSVYVRNVFSCWLLLCVRARFLFILCVLRAIQWKKHTNWPIFWLIFRALAKICTLFFVRFHHYYVWGFFSNLNTLITQSRKKNIDKKRSGRKTTWWNKKIKMFMSKKNMKSQNEKREWNEMLWEKYWLFLDSNKARVF